MPIYEYRCKKCGEFEVTQRITDKPLAKCPTCRAKVTKLISSTSFQLKGSGWYITDYGRGDKGTSGPSETKAETDSSSKASESKSSDTTAAAPKSSDTKSAKTKSPDKATKASASTAAAA